MEEEGTVASLVRAARSGDQAAWNALVDRFLPLVAAIASRHGLSRSDSDDVNQTVWLRLVESLDDIRQPAALAGWIATTTRNECLRLLRLRGRTISVDPLEPSLLDGGATPDDVGSDLEAAERHQTLREALLELPADRRELLVTMLEDPPPSYGEISSRLGIPVGSIGPTRARALAQLRRIASIRALSASELAFDGRG